MDDNEKVINIMMKDANASGPYLSYIANKLGVRQHGYK
uniref:Uncharacterized protein n=1 Tax=Vibrio crassostreae TaxID=246167 RepID=A0A0H3ZP32_9VIBR|nr:hypothetical protein [Vibrio crassostreae]